MAVFKCKMCGGDLDIQTGTSVCTCQYCGIKQTLPRLDDDRRANLYDRANHFRRNNDYDRAMALYESILNEDKGDAEAYWSLVLCKYGVEYVEDPSSHKRIPTCNRTQLTSVFADEDYKQTLENSDEYTKSLYEEEAKAIDAIQKGILAVSNEEEPFDVFVCYKETDHNGKRTPDSVLAQDLYKELMQEGFKVFFARITLEDKIGTAYEPYIFAALQSAKVMVVIGTKAEYFNAVWVKNEWKRYLTNINKGEKKTLIPAYRDMDPYDLPEEFSHLQAQDMGKLGFMQDLIRGIQKLVMNDTKGSASSVGDAVGAVLSPGTAALLDRASIFLDDFDYDSATEYYDRVLDMEPRNAKAYIGKLMTSLRLSTESQLATHNKPLTEYGDFQKAVRFAEDNYRSLLEGYNQTIIDTLENQRKESIYQSCRVRMGNVNSEQSFLSISNELDTISGYKDAADLSSTCRNEAEQLVVLKAQQEEDARLAVIEKERLEKEYNGIMKSLRERINELENEKMSLGMFSRKRAGEIDTELMRLYDQTRETKARYGKDY